MSVGTLFLLNRPQLECMCRLLDRHKNGTPISIAVLGCSKGAEVYSIAFSTRTARPCAKVVISAVDISAEVMKVAMTGMYSLKDLGGLAWPDKSLVAEKGLLAWNTWQGQNVSVFACMDQKEMEAMCERDGDQVQVKTQFKQGIRWHIGDGADPGLVNVLGIQDIVVANNFLCHLEPQKAAACLRNIARLIKPGGYLFVSGVDLDVRTEIAVELGWKPLPDLLKEMHDGDAFVRSAWPWNYCGLEPFDSKRPDWRTRYASVFQIGGAPGSDIAGA